jgi:hypothetical protein
MVPGVSRDPIATSPDELFFGTDKKRFWLTSDQPLLDHSEAPAVSFVQVRPIRLIRPIRVQIVGVVPWRMIIGAVLTHD